MKNLILLLHCLPLICLGQKDSQKYSDFGNSYIIEFKHFAIEVESLTDLLFQQDYTFDTGLDTLNFDLISNLENKKIKIFKNTLKDINIEIAYTTHYVFFWDDGKTRQYPIYTSEYKPLTETNDSVFITPHYTTQESSFSNITLEEIIEIMKTDGLEHPFMRTRLTNINSVYIGSYNVKITAKDKYNNPFSKILIFNLVYGC